MVNRESNTFSEFEEFVKRPQPVSTKKTYKPLDKADIISLRAEIKKRQKVLKKRAKEAKKAEKMREKRVPKIAKQVNKSVQKTIKFEENLNRVKRKNKTRITTPKKRNIFSRLYLANKYSKGDFEYIEDEVNMYRNGELSDGIIEEDWKDIQKYEDARDDVKLRKGWIAFKVALAGIALTSAILGAGYVIKTSMDEMHNQFEQMEEMYKYNQNKANLEMMEKRAAGMALRFRDQEFFYEYTNGNPSLENWENLPEGIKEHVRNPVTAAEAAYTHDNDQSHFYIMVDGDFTTEKWEALPPEIKQYIREPVSTAKEAYENGEDQIYLYELSRGIITEEFWQSLPAEVRQYVRNPVELAKSYARSGDELGYLKEFSKNEEKPERVDHNFWSFLPDELKEFVKDPNLVTTQEDLSIAQTNNSKEDKEER